MNKAFLSQVFSSIQGEGIYLGVPQVFVRFAGCNRSCRYCDTPTRQEPHFELSSRSRSTARRGGSNQPQLRRNPVTTASLARIVERLERTLGPHHSLSLTGGEPLLQADFLEDFLSRTKLPLPVYLETNGTLPDACARIIRRVSIVAADMKLPSCTGEPLDLKLSERFLQVARQKKLFVKIVLTSGVDPSELEEAARILASVGRDIPLVLQPVTPVRRTVPPSLAAMMEMRARLASILKDVRIIPQVHGALEAP